jgi:hypothetical protein
VCERSSHERGSSVGAELVAFGSEAQPCVSGACVTTAVQAARREQNSPPTGVIATVYKRCS